MKFRCKVNNVPLFLRVAQSMEKVAKAGIVHLSPTHVQLITTGEVNDDVKVWATLSVNDVFRHHNIQSLCNNRIGCHVLFSHLIQALKSCIAADQVVLKLTKRDNQPLLCFLIEHSFPKKMAVTHNVPVVVMTSVQLMELHEPDLPAPEIQVYLPPLKELKTGMERMKSVGEHLSIECNSRGQLSLSCSTDVVNISTIYTNLELASNTTPSAPGVSGEEESSQGVQTQINLRKFSKVLRGCEVLASHVVCCIVKNHAVVLVQHVDESDLNTLTYYIPIVFD